MPSASPVPTTRPHTNAVLAIILVSYLMIIIDTSIIITGLPSIQQEMGFTATGLSWVQNAYTLTFGGLLLLGARAGDVLGLRRVFITGLAVFAIASLAVGAAPSAGVLVAARAVQGLGSAILVPATLALLTANFPEGRERTRAVAAYGSVAGLGTALGLVLGGVIASLLSWRVGFIINLPIALMLIWATRRFVAPTAGRSGKLDLSGALISTVGMVALVYGIVRAADDGWSDPITLAALATGGILLSVFIAIESRAQQPIVPLRLFASRERSGAYAARLLFIGAMISFFLFTSQFLQGVLGYSPMQAGLAFLPMAVVNFAVALTAPRLMHRFNNPPLLIAGIGVTLVGMAWLSRLTPDSNYFLAIALPMAFVGAGQGIAFAPMTASGVAGVAKHDAGAASGLINAAHQLGGAIGLGLVVTLAAAAETGSTAAERLASGVTAALTGAAGLLALALIVVLALVVRRRQPAKIDPEPSVEESSIHLQHQATPTPASA